MKTSFKKCCIFCCIYFWGNFCTNLGNFLFQHLVTLPSATKVLWSMKLFFIISTKMVVQHLYNGLVGKGLSNWIQGIWGEANRAFVEIIAYTECCERHSCPNWAIFERYWYQISHKSSQKFSWLLGLIWKMRLFK